MNYSEIKNYDVANGKGVRVTLFVSGCERHCKGCFNTETWDFDNGLPFTDDVAHKILDMCEPNYISGLTLLGGEPLHPANLEKVTELARAFRNRFPDKNIWCYTGYRYEEVKNYPIMRYLDVLVDGEFIEDKKDIRLQFRGSSNQRIIELHGGEDNESY